MSPDISCKLTFPVRSTGDLTPPSSSLSHVHLTTGYRGGSSEEESKPSSPNVSHHRPRERKRRRQFRNRGGKSPELSSQSPSPTREEDENIYDQSSECPLDVQEERAVNYKHFQGLFPPTIDRKWSSSSDSEYSRLTPVYPVEVKYTGTEAIRYWFIVFILFRRLGKHQGTGESGMRH